jgi:hypothetical protein
MWLLLLRNDFSSNSMSIRLVFYQENRIARKLHSIQSHLIVDCSHLLKNRVDFSIQTEFRFSYLLIWTVQTRNRKRTETEPEPTFWKCSRTKHVGEISSRFDFFQGTFTYWPVAKQLIGVSYTTRWALFSGAIIFSVTQSMVQKISRYNIFVMKFWHHIRIKADYIHFLYCVNSENTCVWCSSMALEESENHSLSHRICEYTVG